MKGWHGAVRGLRRLHSRLLNPSGAEALTSTTNYLAALKALRHPRAAFQRTISFNALFQCIIKDQGEREGNPLHHPFGLERAVHDQPGMQAAEGFRRSEE